MTTKSRELEAVLRDDLGAFIQKTVDQVVSDEEYSPNWHIDAIAHHLELCESGDIKRLIITLPPRHLKSICASVAFPAWLLGRNPESNVVCVSYTNELAEKHARDCRDVIEAPWYRKTFKGMRLSRRKNTQTEIVTTKKGSRYATSVGGTLTGRAGNYIIIDDPINPDRIMSEAERQDVNDWFQRVAYTRINNRRKGVIIVVMQRLHEDDLVGHVMDLDDWTVLNIPAIAEEETRYRVGRHEKDVYVRDKGELIDPERFDAEELERTKHALGTYDFAAQYQQNPIPVEGNMVKQQWFGSYTDLPPREAMDAVLLSWDTASDAGEMNDYSVCTVWGVVGERYYLIDVVRKKLAYPDLRNLAHRLVRQYKADIVLVERASSGTPLSQDLRRQLGIRVESLRPAGDKVVRFSAQSAVIEQGRVHLPAEATWLNTFKKELLGFPGTKHDDQVDSVEMFLRFVTGRRGGAIVSGRNRGRPRSRIPRPCSGRERGFSPRRHLDEMLHSPGNGPALF